MKRSIMTLVVLLCVCLLGSCRKQEDTTIEEALASTLPAIATPELTQEPLPEGLASIDELIEQGVLPEDEGVAETEESVVPVALNVPELTDENGSDNSSAVTEPPVIMPEDSVAQTPDQTETDSNSCCEYGAYLAMSAAEQEAFMNTFETTMAFIEWSQAAETEHKSHAIELTGVGVDLDLSQFIHG